MYNSYFFFKDLDIFLEHLKIFQLTFGYQLETVVGLVLNISKNS